MLYVVTFKNFISLCTLKSFFFFLKFITMSLLVDNRLVSDLAIISRIVSGPVILNQEIWTSFGGNVHNIHDGSANGVVLKTINRWYKPFHSPPVKLIVAMVTSV